MAEQSVLEITAQTPSLAAYTPQRPSGVLTRQQLGLPVNVSPTGRSIVAVCAPAGYGKTTTLLNWYSDLQDQGWDTAWLGLDAKHRDPIRFFEGLIAAIRKQCATFGELTTKHILSANSSRVEPVLISFLQDLHAVEGPKAIFVDDLHELIGSDSCDLLQEIMNHAPDNVSLFVAGRELPPLSLAAWKLEGRLIEYSVEDLRFSSDEAASLLQDLRGLQLSGELVEQLATKTEGWPAALQMCALAMAQHPAPEQILKNFGGQHQDLGRYLIEAVFGSLEPELRDFVLKVAVLDKISVEVANYVTQREDSNQWIEELERRNLFLVPLNTIEREYRFHALFAEFLRAWYQKNDAASWQASLLRAKEWSLKSGDLETAVNYSLRAKDYDAAAELLATIVDDLVHVRGRHQTLFDWVQAIPKATISAYPRILLNQAWAFDMSHRPSESTAVLKQLRDNLEQLPEALRSEVLCGVEMQEAAQQGLNDHGVTSRDKAREWLDRWESKATAFEIGTVEIVHSFGCRTQSELDTALQASLRSRESMEEGGSYFGRVWADMVWLTVLIKRGQFQDAYRGAKEALALSCERLGDESAASCMVAAVLAYVAYELGHLKEARDALERGLRQVERESSVDPIMYGYFTMARLAQADGDVELTINTLKAGEQFGTLKNLPRLAYVLAAERAFLHLRRGEIEAADAVIQARGIRSDNSNALAGLLNEKVDWLEARRSMATGDMEDALPKLKKLSKHAESHGQRRKLIELEILRAIAFKANGQPNDAVRVFRHSLFMAAEEGLLRVFIDEAPAIEDVLTAYWDNRKTAWAAGTEKSIVDVFLLKLVDALGLGEVKKNPMIDQSMMVERLTKRELDILRHMESGLPNKRLSEVLFIAEGTLKWHLHNIYAKLSVRNRSGAIAKARQLSLIG